MQFITINKQSPSTIVREELETLKQRIIANMYAANAVATGKTIKSMNVVVADRGRIEGTLYGRKFFGAVETGRRPTLPGTPPSKPTLYEAILAWCKARGIRGKDRKATRGIAWAITTTIHKRGTMLFRQGGRASIYSSEIPRTLKDVRERLMFLTSVQAKNIRLNDVTIK